MRVFATPAQLNKVDFALETGSKITEHYIDYFQIPYPLPKLGKTTNCFFQSNRKILLLFSEIDF